jgi:hypothetical protein
VAGRASEVPQRHSDAAREEVSVGGGPPRARTGPGSGSRSAPIDPARKPKCPACGGRTHLRKFLSHCSTQRTHRPRRVVRCVGAPRRTLQWRCVFSRFPGEDGRAISLAERRLGEDPATEQKLAVKGWQTAIGGKRGRMRIEQQLQESLTQAGSPGCSGAGVGIGGKQTRPLSWLISCEGRPWKNASTSRRTESGAGPTWSPGRTTVFTTTPSVPPSASRPAGEGADSAAGRRRYSLPTLLICPWLQSATSPFSWPRRSIKFVRGNWTPGSLTRWGSWRGSS